MNVKDNGKQLIITIDKVNPPRMSSSGKTMLLASDKSKGDVKCDGQEVTIQVNAHFPVTH